MYCWHIASIIAYMTLLSACTSPIRGVLATETQGHQVPYANLQSTTETAARDTSNSQAYANATPTAWAALPPNMGTPTVSAVLPYGLDLGDPTSWVRHVDATGFAFDVLKNAVFAPNSPENAQPGIYAALQVRTLGTVAPSAPPDKDVGVAISRRGNPDITARDFPQNMTTNQGTANWLSQFPFSESAQVTMYVRGMINTAPNTVNADFWMFLAPVLYVNVFDERCDASITFRTSFGMPGPAADALVMPLDEVVAEHFPVLDHMYRSVQFPPECGMP